MGQQAPRRANIQPTPKPEPKDSNVAQKKQKSMSVQEPISYDVVITHSDRDKGLADQLAAALKTHGLVCLFDSAEKQSGPPISSGTSLIWILSEHSVTSNYCGDRIALAYIANVSIVPVNLISVASLKEKLEFGTKLVLQAVKWYDFTNEENLQQQLGAVGDHIMQKKAKRTSLVENPEVNEQLKHVSHRHKPVSYCLITCKQIVIFLII